MPFIQSLFNMPVEISTGSFLFWYFVIGTPLIILLFIGPHND